MLLEFGAKNFFSFKEGFELSLRLAKDCPKDISNNKQFSNILAIKGANASGKTNVIKVLSFLNEFVTNSFSILKPDENILIKSYFNNKDIISIYAIFLFDDIEYKYEIDLTDEKVISEIISKKEKNWMVVIQRDENKITTNAEYNEIESINLTRSNASIVSIARQYGIQKIDMIYDLFENITTNVDVFGRQTDIHIPLYHQYLAEKYNKDNDVLKFISDFLKEADTGITSLIINKGLDTETDKNYYFPVFNYDVNEEENFLTFHYQSNGIKTLYRQLGIYFNTLSSGGVLALDEFDINLHPDILPMLLNLFEDENINTKNAQLICTTHNYDIMDRLGKYKIVLVNKENNESFLYRLDEIPGDILRNDKPISPIYNANKIGGKPNII
jgi:AAA15 family ATPase/GTPase